MYKIEIKDNLGRYYSWWLRFETAQDAEEIAEQLTYELIGQENITAVFCWPIEAITSSEHSE